jgi:ribosomal protein L11 methylase PrmA
MEGAYRLLRPESVPFISYPYEWTFSQLKEAALLTLDLQKRALEAGMWLKDASAYNVQFFGSKPVFIDTLSFELYPEGQPWVAYQQFCRHFLAPLALVSRCHRDALKLMRTNVDGIPLDLASRLLPLRSRFSFSLLTHIHIHARSLGRYAGSPEVAQRARTRGVSPTALRGLIDNLESTVRRMEWSPAATEWSNYYEATNYSDRSFSEKKSIVRSYIDEAHPTSVWDLGANTGVFSRLAADSGAYTVSFDYDASAVDQNYREARQNREERILPLVMDLSNPSPGLGWAGAERMSLQERGPVDLVMALALVHHLAIGNNLPLTNIASWLRGLSENLIVEFVPKEDSQTQRLLASREDIFPHYTQEAFEKAFGAYFDLKQRSSLEGTSRTIYLYGCR